MLEKSFVLGIDHHASHVDIREKLSELQASDLSSKLPIEEIYVLSTCNRYEVYVSAPCAHSAEMALNKLKSIFAKQIDVPNSEIDAHIYEKSGEEMLRHGFNVASSLESMVLGEPQILGQMKKAYKEAKSEGNIKTELDKFLGATFHVGKRVRHETFLAAEPVSVASASVKLAEEIYKGDFVKCHVVLLGAGEMCTAAARYLHGKGIKKITVVNRTLSHAEALAEEVNGLAVTIPSLPAALEAADIVISCTGAREPLVTFKTVEHLMKMRSEKELSFIDIAVPRDIEESVALLNNVSIYDMDRLGEQIQRSQNKREAQVEHVEKIINEEVVAFSKWSEERKNSHIVKYLRSSFEDIREEVLEQHSSDEAKEATRLLLNKLLHGPTRMIKSGYVPAKGVEMALGLLFDIRCPRVEFLSIETDSIKKGECPFMDVMRKEGLSH